MLSRRSWRVRRIAGLSLVVAALCVGPPARVSAECLTTCSTFYYTRFAKLEMCRPWGGFDEDCEEPWTLAVLKPDGSRFRDLGEVWEVSRQPNEDASWIVALRPEDPTKANPASTANQTYVVYDLETEVYQYQGANRATAETEWETENAMPHPNGCVDGIPTLLHMAGPPELSDGADGFRRTLLTLLRDWIFNAAAAAYVSAVIAIILWPVSLGIMIVGSLFALVVFKRAQRVRVP